MSKFLMLLGVIVLSAAWLCAQTSPSSTSPSTSGSSQTDTTGSAAGQSNSTSTSSGMGQTSSSATSSGSAESIEGCLGGSAGAYTLTSDSGTTYQLSGDTSKLSDHVGHEVKVKGTPSNSSSASGTSGSSSSGSSTGSMGSSASGSQTLNVESVKMVSSTCKSGSTSK